MLISKLRTVVASLAAMAAVTFIALPAYAAEVIGARKLEPGVWIARVVEVPGAQWSYIVSPDPSGRRGAAHGTVEVGLYTMGLDDMTDRTSPLLIDLVLVKPGIVKFTSVWYGLHKVSNGVTTAEVVYIGVNRGEIKYTGPGKAAGTHNIEYYLPTQDVDHDGLPDPGQLPIGGGQVHTIETRLGQ